MTGGVTRAGRKDKKEKERRKNQCEAGATFSFVMVTKSSGGLTDGAHALYPPLYLRGSRANISERFNVYDTVNEKS